MSMATSEFEDGPIGQLRLIGWFLAAVLASALVGALVQHMESKHYSTLSRMESTAKTELLRAAMLEDIITEDRGRLETTVEVYQESNEDFFALEIVDEDGNKLMSWERDNALAAQNILFFFTRYYPRQRVAAPVVFEGEQYGIITAVWDQSAVGARRDTHTYAMAGVIAFLCFAFAFVSYQVGRRHR